MLDFVCKCHCEITVLLKTFLMSSLKAKDIIVYFLCLDPLMIYKKIEIGYSTKFNKIELYLHNLCTSQPEQFLVCIDMCCLFMSLFCALKLSQSSLLGKSFQTLDAAISMQPSCFLLVEFCAVSLL